MKYGKHTDLVETFLTHLRVKTDWDGPINATKDGARYSARTIAQIDVANAAESAVGLEILDYAGEAAWVVAWGGSRVNMVADLAIIAAHEILGHEVLAAQNKKLFFLPIFGIDSIEMLKGMRDMERRIQDKALALVNEVFTEMGGSPIDYEALVGAGDVVALSLCRAIERHEIELASFKGVEQKLVSELQTSVDSAEKKYEAFRKDVNSILLAIRKSVVPPKEYENYDVLTERFMVESDPLIKALGTALKFNIDYADAQKLRAALEALGLEIKEKGK